MPHLYESIEGWFSYSSLYDDMITRFPNGRFCEIGNWKGRSAVYLLEKIKETNSGAFCFFVDPGSGNLEHSSLFIDRDPDWLHDELTSNLFKVGGKFLIIRDFSINAAKGFVDNDLDFVFIDGNHDGDEPLKDMRAWWPKVKSGGVIAFHDIDQPSIQDCANIFCKEVGAIWTRSPSPIDCGVIEK